MIETTTPLAAPEPAGRPWYRGTLFGLALIILFMSSAVAVYLNKQPPEDLAASHNLPHGPSADHALPFDFSTLTVDRDEVRSGGPSLDGIPSITTAAARANPDPHADQSMWRGEQAPDIVPADQADFLSLDSRVVGVTINGQSRAYPISVLNWHECVNDVLGGVPIAVTYCPLCDSVTILDRRVGTGDEQLVVELGISGFLYNSNVLLYDRQEHNLWSQISLQAIAGPRAGATLQHLDNWTLTQWSSWFANHPDSDVLSFDTGFRRDYESNPYEGFGEHDRIMFPVGRDDDRLPRKQRIIGVRYGEEHLAFVINNGPRQIKHGFADGTRLILNLDDTGGVQIAKQPDGAQAIHTYWYAWAATHPKTQIIRE